ncbi:MAG: filamentous hemagglutinin N-terminal domain-containing protein [Cyanobacteria bacterium P01_G01_bin.54]
MTSKFILPLLTGLGSIAYSVSAQAQLIPDQTLGAEGSVVTPVHTTRDRIDGGAIRGTNLFHSFAEFNIDPGHSVYFSNPSSIRNILTRVTGNNISEIFGTLGVLGGANLWLINPNGLYFGPEARLDVEGSFTATTATGVWFGPEVFSATNPELPPLLTVEPGALFQHQVASHQAQLRNEAQLRVAPGQALVLASDRLLHAGSITAPGGTVSLLGQQVALIKDAKINVSGPQGGGTVHIGGGRQGRGPTPTARQTYISPDTTIQANATVQGDGGEVILWADDRTEFYGQISATGQNGGFVEVSGKQSLAFRGEVDTQGLNGQNGTLLLDPAFIEIRSGTGDGDNNASTSTFGTGQILFSDPGPTVLYESELEGMLPNNNLVIQATQDITIKDLADNVLSFWPGPGGSIAFEAGGAIRVEDPNDEVRAEGRNLSFNGATLQLGALNTLVDDNASFNIQTAPSGNLTLTATGNIEVGNISTNNSVGSILGIASAGNSGNVSITSTHGNIQTGDILTDNEAGSLSGIAATAGNGGNVEITAQNGAIQVGEINTSNQVSTSGDATAGDGGNVQITASSGAIQVGGINTSNQVSASGDATAGDGGNVQITASSGAIQVGEINTSSEANTWGDAVAGMGGEITFNAGGAITIGDLSNSSAATSASGTATSQSTQDIALTAQGDIFLGKIDTHSQSLTQAAVDSLITTPDVDVLRALLIGGSFPGVTGGDAGNVTIRSTQGGVFSPNKEPIFAFGGASIVSLLPFSISAIPEILPTGQGGQITVQAADSIEMGALFSIGQVGGAINVTSDTGIHLNPRASFLSVGIGSQDGNDITVTTPTLSSVNGSIRSRTFGSGRAGDVRINADNLFFDDGGIVSDTRGSGRSGDLFVNVADTIELSNNANLATQSADFTGDAGNVVVNSRQLIGRSGGRLSASTSGTGRAGNITVNVRDRIELTGTFVDFDSTENASGFVAGVREAGQGSGNITVNTRQLSVNNGANLITGNIAQNAVSGGNLTINASEFVELAGVSDSGNVQSALLTDAFGRGSSGDLTINTPQLTIRDGAVVSASTLTEGQGGDIQIKANTIEISGTDPNGRASGIFATAGFAGFSTPFLNLVAQQAAQAGTPVVFAQILNFTQTAFGSSAQSGNINLQANQVTVANGGAIALSNEIDGRAGELNLSTDSLTLRNGQIVAETVSGLGGNLNFNVAGSLLMRQGSVISTTAGQAGRGGDGGNMTLNAGFILSVPQENNDIIANAFGGSGGNITINTSGLYNIAFRNLLFPRDVTTNDITASSDIGLNGVQTFNRLSFPAEQGLNELPDSLVDAEDILNQDVCAFQNDRIANDSSLTAIGWGGIPHRADDPMGHNTNIPIWASRPPAIAPVPSIAASPHLPEPSSHSAQFVQDGLIDEEGLIHLTAELTSTTLTAMSLKPSTCQAPKSLHNSLIHN